MRAFFYANHDPQVFDDQETHLVGHLNGLQSGSYIVAAKASIATFGYSSYSQEPKSGYCSLILSFGGMADRANAGVVQADGHNMEVVSLMVAAETTSASNARLFWHTSAAIPMTVGSIRMAALQVDELQIFEDGSPYDDPEDAERSWRATWIGSILFDPGTAMRLPLHIRDDD